MGSTERFRGTSAPNGRLTSLSSNNVFYGATGRALSSSGNFSEPHLLFLNSFILLSFAFLSFNPGTY